MQDRPTKHFAFIFSITAFIAFWLIVIVLNLSSCLTVQRAQNKIDKYPQKAKAYGAAKMMQHQDTLATLCHLVYPCIDKTETSTTNTQGDVKPSGDSTSIQINFDSLKAAYQSGVEPKYVTVKVPIYLRVDTEKITEKIIQTDKAQYKALSVQFDSLKALSLREISKRDEIIKLQAVSLKTCKAAMLKYQIGLALLILIIIAYFIIKNQSKLWQLMSRK